MMSAANLNSRFLPPWARLFLAFPVTEYFYFLLYSKHVFMFFTPSSFLLFSSLSNFSPSLLPPFFPPPSFWPGTGAGFYRLVSTDFAHLFLALYSVMSHGWLETSIGGSMYTVEIGGQDKERLYVFICFSDSCFPAHHCIHPSLFLFVCPDIHLANHHPLNVFIHRTHTEHVLWARPCTRCTTRAELARACSLPLRNW